MFVSGTGRVFAQSTPGVSSAFGNPFFWACSRMTRLYAGRSAERPDRCASRSVSTSRSGVICIGWPGEHRRRMLPSNSTRRARVTALRAGRRDRVGQLDVLGEHSDTGSVPEAGHRPRAVAVFLVTMSSAG